MSLDELTVFDIKYNEGIERLNDLLSSEAPPSGIKNYIERYKIDKSREKVIQKSNNTDNIGNIKKEEKRKQIVNIYEIRDHDKKVQQLFNKNYLKNEIEWFKIKKREDENKNKYNYNQLRFENDISFNKYDDNKELIRANNFKMKKFSNLANKVNIDKFMKIKKLNQNQNINTEQRRKEEITNNNIINKIKDGIFIPYSEYKQYEINNKANKIDKININKINDFYSNKLEKINIKNISQNNITNKNNNKTNNKNLINKKKNSRNQIKKNNNKKIIIQSTSSNKKRISQSQENKSPSKNTARKDINNRYKNDIRKPLDTKIDYLKERKASQEHRVKTIKLYKSKKILNNIELLNLQSQKYEDKAKNQEQLMRIKGNKNYGNEDNVKLSNLLIDSITTKLAILNQISSKNK